MAVSYLGAWKPSAAQSYRLDTYCSSPPSSTEGPEDNWRAAASIHIEGLKKRVLSEVVISVNREDELTSKSEGHSGKRRKCSLFHILLLGH